LKLAFATGVNFFWEQMTTNIFKVADFLKQAFASAVAFFKGDVTTAAPEIYEKIKSALQSAGAFLTSAWGEIFPKVSIPLRLAFGAAVNYLNEVFQKTVPSIYSSLKIAFAEAINFLGTELAVAFARTAAAFKSLLPGGGNMNEEANKAEAKARAKPALIDIGKLEQDKQAIENKAIKPAFDLTDLEQKFAALNYKTVKPLFDTKNLKEDLTKDYSLLSSLKKETTDKARSENPTAPPPPPGGGFIPKIDDKPLGSIVSSMAKIGGDVGGPQTGALDVARQQLTQQQRTADNTAKMVEKLNKLTPAQSTQTASIYS
jgi:hypothetical protein